MPGKRCTVAICNNSHTKTKQKGVVYFNFPKDPEIRSRWVHLCRREGKWNADSCSVCSDHFLPEDFERDLKSELLKLPCKKKLKQTAVPSQKLTPDCQNKSNKSTTVCKNVTNSIDLKLARNDRYLNRENKQLVESLLAPEIIPEQTVLQDELTTNADNQPCQNIKCLELIKENISLKAALLKKTRILRRKSLKNRRLTNTIKGKKRENIKVGAEEKIKDKLKTAFTKNQLDLLLGNKKRVKWTKEEISIALTLRYLGKRTYLYLKKKCNFPLPSLSTLNRWITNINVRQGFFDDILRMMKSAGEKMETHEKIAVVMYDEMKVKETYEYDQKFDQVIGPHKQMQVIVLRGLFSNWKQPIFLDFDTSITPEIVLTAINKAQACGFEVVACVSDMGGGNYGMWKKLDVTIDKPWFENPSSKSKKVFMFADAPHTLKLLRNWFLDTGFQLNDSIFVNKDAILALLKLDSNELKVCHKLNEKHILCEGAERQNVRLAAQLFSYTVAKALELYTPGDDESNTDHLSQFIVIVNDWFDIMNTYVPKKSLEPTKCGYGLYEEEQTKCLDNMFKTISTMRCKGKNKLLPFQRGILLSINATKALLAYVKENYEMDYILTHRLNQDTLENLFSQIRTRGGLNDHPTPLNAIHRLRMIIFGKNPGVIQSHMNTTDVSESEFITATVINKLDLNTRCEDDECQELMEVEDTASADIELSEVEGGAQQYLAGWVAKKHLKKYPSLGKYTHKTSTQPTNDDSWIRHLSKGGLVEPSEEWSQISQVCELEFKSFHGENVIKKERNVVKFLASKVFERFDSFPLEVISSYIKMRTIIRMKDLNLQLSELKIKKRQGSTDRSRTKLKKIKKIAT